MCLENAPQFEHSYNITNNKDLHFLYQKGGSRYKFLIALCLVRKKKA